MIFPAHNVISGMQAFDHFFHCFDTAGHVFDAGFDHIFLV